MKERRRSSETADRYKAIASSDSAGPVDGVRVAAPVGTVLGHKLHKVRCYDCRVGSRTRSKNTCTQDTKSHHGRLIRPACHERKTRSEKGKYHRSDSGR